MRSPFWFVLVVSVLLASAVDARPARVGARIVGAKVMGQGHLPTHVWTRGDQAVLLDAPRASRRGLRRGFRLKRGTRLAVGKMPGRPDGYYHVMSGDNRPYPRAGAFRNTITGHHLRGYVARAAVGDKPYEGGWERVDELFVKRETTLLRARGRRMTLAKGTWLWALTGLPEAAPPGRRKGAWGFASAPAKRYRVRLDDFVRYPRQTRARVEGYVDAGDVRPPSVLAGATR